MLAYFDSFSGGLVPCRILRIEPRTNCLSGWVITAKLTAGRGPYKRGETVHSNGLHIVPRSAIRRTKYSTRILPYSWFAEAAQAGFHIDREGN